MIFTYSQQVLQNFAPEREYFIFFLKGDCIFYRIGFSTKIFLLHNIMIT